MFAQWCQAELNKKKAALEYLEERSIHAESRKEFSLGYCPNDVKGLLNFAQKQGILATNLIDAHLLMEGKQGLYSPFEERIIFPIKDPHGRFVGFGGRIYKAGDDRPKYYNSHDHTFFNKGTMLFGLDRAKKAIAQAESAFLVEGYTDLIIMNQYGFTNTIATLGTACTQEHLKHIARFAQKLYILYDGDAAGQNAIMRLTELCWNAALDPYVITLPAQHDPASYLTSGGSLVSLVEQARDIFSFILSHLGSDFEHKSLQEKLATATKILQIISTLPDQLKRDILLTQASHTFNIPLQTLNDACKRSSSRTTYDGRMDGVKDANEIHDQASCEISQLEKKLFSAILYHKGDIAQEDGELLRLWLSPKLRSLFESVARAKTESDIDMNALFETVTDEEKELISGFMMEALQEKTASLQDLLVQFYKKQWKITIHNVKLRVSEAQQAGDLEAVKKVLTDINELKKKMLRRGIHD